MKIKAKIKNLKVKLTKLPKAQKIGIVLGLIVFIELLRRYYQKLSGNQEYSTVVTGATNGREGAAINLIAKSNKRHFLLNTTGYGFNPETPSGLSPEWVDRIEALKFDGKYFITGVRVNVRWQDLEPNAGVYDLQTVQKNIDFCRERGLSLSYCFWPFRYSDTDMIPSNSRITGMNGEIFNLEGGKIMGSLSNAETNQKINRAIQQLAGKLATYERAFYISMVMGDSEEFNLPVVNVGKPYQSITDWSVQNQNAFRDWCSTRGVPFSKPEGIYSLNMSNTIGREYARFTTQVLRDYWTNFRSAVKSVSSLPVCLMYADCGGQQNAWYLHGNMGYIAQDADVVYGTDDRKRMTSAVNMGTFPNAMNAIEFDATDLGETGGYDSNLDYNRMRNEMDETLGDGVQVMHLGMSFSPRIHRGMESTLKYLWEKYFNGTYTKPTKPVTEVNITPKFWAGSDFYEEAYNATKNHIKAVAPDFFG